ncbi:hypothetical protein EWF20_14680 [Sulfolobus sp. S-194]|uniref:hypothetical protein n=1 Tax=Sulfolobus sp. S-194 TaxID=2512240 RepID=UPI0014370808|nr:hypothetical protein [Sulfolobus sp. S-194]QIW25272.1 hypothetical protein EWF20_14680 [Sulfolobus sp. S-194]
MIKLTKSVNIPWISALILIIAYSLGNGIYITINRITYYPVFEWKLASMFLSILSAALMVLYNPRKYAFLLPLSLLSFYSLQLTPFLLLIPIIYELRKGIGLVINYVLIIVNSSMITWLILRILLGINSYFSVPLLILNSGLPIAIPIIWFSGILFALLNGVNNIHVRIPLFLPYVTVLLIALIPYIPFINPAKIPETVDFTYYYSWLLHPTFTGWFFYSRPLYLLLLYSLSLIFGPYQVAYYEFVFISLLYVYSAYKLASAIDNKMANLSALLAAVSPMLITFLYSGLEANLFSISLMFISISYLIKRKKLPLAILLSILALLSHIYAWAQLSSVIIVYYLFMFIFKKISPTKYEIVYLFSLIPFTFIGLYAIFSGIFPVPVGLFNFNQLVYQIAVVSWGSNNALIYYLLSAYGTRYLNGILKSLYVVSLLGIIVLQPASNLVIDLPLFIPTAYAINSLNKLSLSYLVILFLILWGIYMSVNSVPYLG